MDGLVYQTEISLLAYFHLKTRKRPRMRVIAAITTTSSSIKFLVLAVFLTSAS